MDWILFSVIAYFLLAVESVANKFLITGKVKSWKLYLFYIGLLSFFSFAFIPFGFVWPGWKIFGVAVISGMIFFGYLAYLFYSLKGSSATRVFVLVGATSTLITLFLSGIFLGELTSLIDLFGVVLLVMGGILIAFKYYKGRFFSQWKKAAIAGVFLGISMVLLKWAYDAFAGHSFITVYISSRVGIVFMTAMVMLIPSFHQRVFGLLRERRNKKHAQHFGAVVLVKALAGFSTLILNWSIQMGSVTIVNALASVQYLFVFFISMILAVYFKEALGERLEIKNTMYKAVGSVLVVTGIFLVLV